MLEIFWIADHVHRRGLRRVWVLIWIVCTAATGTLGWADEPTAVPQGVLQLRRGDFVAGRLTDHADANQLAWQHPSFASEFVFPFRAITTATFAKPTGASPAAGEFCVELVNGDRWYGSVVGIDRDVLTLRSPEVGDLAIRREMLRRLFRWEGGEALHYSGPGALANWQQSSTEPAFAEKEDAEPAWQDLGGKLCTDQTLTSIYSDVGLPTQAEIEIAVSWSGTPNFVIAFGVDDAPSSVARALRLEVWNQTFVLIREGEEAAAILALGTRAEFDHQLSLSIALDQTAGRAVVYSTRGERLGEVHLKEEVFQTLPGIRVENIAGNIQLESLRVIAGKGLAGNRVDADPQKPSSAQMNAAHFQLSDGGTLHGQLLRAEDASWVIAEGDQEREVDPATVLAVDFESRTETPGKQPADGDAERLRVVTHSGIRATGSLQKIEAEQLYLQADGVAEALPLGVGELRSLTVLDSESGGPSTDEASSPDRSEPIALEFPEKMDDSPQQTGRIGRLELAGTRLHGRLADAQATDEASAFRFHPLDAVTPAALLGAASGRLVYRDREPEPPAAEQRRPQPRRPANQGILGAFAQAFGGAGDSERDLASPATGTSLHLRSGDVLPCEVTQIDADGVGFESPTVGVTRLPHDQIRAVALATGSVAAIDESKRERLLTVPRMRKATPPTHLIVSSDGDFLRGRLESLDAHTLRFENRLETMEIPRRFVSHIIWFHADELPEAAPEAQAAAAETPESPTIGSTESEPASGLRVQSVHRNGVRLSCVPRQIGGGELIGESPQLGICLIALGAVDQLLIGREIEAATSDSPYRDWRLTHAPEPKVLQEGGSPGMPSTGVASPLIGMVAPEFDLELLAGGKFRLSEQRGKVVVLDFWATWCGPCIQSMPQVEEAVAAFPEDDVILVAVNLQETAEQIRGVLERLKRNPTVALDIDGVVASQYHANAIPQTVVIDREGRVTRLFIGSDDELGEHLRAAIEEAR